MKNIMISKVTADLLDTYGIVGLGYDLTKLRMASYIEDHVKKYAIYNDKRQVIKTGSLMDLRDSGVSEVDSLLPLVYSGSDEYDLAIIKVINETFEVKRKAKDTINEVIFDVEPEL